MNAHVHIWKKTDSAPRDDKSRVRSWGCRCGAHKTRISGPRPQFKAPDGTMHTGTAATLSYTFTEA